MAVASTSFLSPQSWRMTGDLTPDNLVSVSFAGEEAGISPAVPPLSLSQHVTTTTSSLIDEQWHGESSSATKSPTRVLPLVVGQSKTARESIAGKPIASVTDHHLPYVHSVRIRFAPPQRIDTLPNQGRLPLKRYLCFEAGGEDDVPIADAALAARQTETARCFAALFGLVEKTPSGAAKATLEQIVSVLYNATYANNQCDMNEKKEEEYKHLQGREYFSLLAHAYTELAKIEAETIDLGTRVHMEDALRQELTQQLQQLDRDLQVTEQQQAQKLSELEAEQLLVAQLEAEYASLVAQEADVKREWEELAAQVEKQQDNLQELRKKSSSLDVAVRIPMKKFVEEKKLKDQEDAQDAMVDQSVLENAKLEAELARLDAQINSLDQQYEADAAVQARVEKELHEAEATRELLDSIYHQTRDCHTPRPSWDEIIKQTPELSVQKYQWEMIMGSFDQQHGPSDDDEDVVDHEANQQLRLMDRRTSNLDHSRDRKTKETGRTKKLVEEMLHWIERLQKHCGVNLHLSRIWHDVEEARVELNILQHQLDRALHKCSRQAASRQLNSNNDGEPVTSPSKRKAKKQEYIIALGNHEEIPKFLRHQGKVKQRTVKKGELETIIRQVWTEKRKRERRNPFAILSLEEILYEKLHRKYGFQPLIAEWGYNLLLALNEYAWDAEIELFLLCLTGAISDQVYVDQEEMLTCCQLLLLQLTECYGNESFVTERRVLLKDALIALRKFFPLKSSLQLQAIEKAIIRDMHKMKRGGNDSILYIDDILRLEVNYPRGFFVKTIRTQHFKEIQDYYALVVNEIEQRDQSKTGQLPISHIKEAILTVDPLADVNVLHNALAKGVGLKARSQLDIHEVVEYREILKTMNTTCLMKFSLNYDPNAEINWHREGKRPLHEPDQRNALVPTEQVA